MEYNGTLWVVLTTPLLEQRAECTKGQPALPKLCSFTSLGGEVCEEVGEGRSHTLTTTVGSDGHWDGGAQLRAWKGWAAGPGSEGHSHSPTAPLGSGAAIRERQRAYLLIGLFALGSIGFLYSSDYVFDNILEPHQQIRIKVVLGMEEDLAGAGYNVNQSKIAIGSGGLTGKGFLNGTQTKLKYVPEQDTDFIFCTVGEEQGFVGSAAVLLLFLALILRLIATSERQTSTFGRVYGYSVVSIFLFHLFINIGMVLGLTPVIGIPLPFFSYGGSSLWGFTILLFIFLRIDAGRSRRL